MRELDNFRAKYPQYGDLDDATLASKLAAKYPDAYGDLPGKVNVKQPLLSKSAPLTENLGPIPIGGGDFPAGLDVGSYSESLNQMTKPRLMAGAAAPYAPMAGMTLGTLAAAPTVAGTAVGGGLGYWAGKQAEQLLGNYAKAQPQRMTPIPELASQGLEAATIGMMPLAAGVAIDSTLAALAPKAASLAEKLYASSIRMPLSRKWTKVRGEEGTTMVKESIRKGIKEEIPPSEYGLEKLKGIKKQTGQNIGDLVKGTPGKGNLDDIVSSGIAKAETKAISGEAPEAEAQAIKAWADAYRKGRSSNLTAEEMQKMKTELYDRINWDKISGKGDALTETLRKGMAHELRLQLETLDPFLKAANREYAAAANLEEALERALPRMGNRDVFNLGTKVLIGRDSWPLAVINQTIGHPAIKSRIAFLLSRLSRRQPLITP